MRPFKIVCRGSRLSLAQADIFKRRLLDAYPRATVEVIIKETEGDINQIQPLADMEGKDFFTKDIQDVLLSGQADFAVHSLKDVSGEEFFKNNTYAIVEREDPRDVAIFHESVLDKIKSEQPLRLGTSSPRRAEMAVHFLKKALPIVRGNKASMETMPIRGNVDTRLQKLDRNEYDGIILACAGLNRLLRSDAAREDVSALLKNKKLMLLPLLECPPAPGQGAIVAETTPGNADAISVLQFINNKDLAVAVTAERTLAHRYGSGCHQRFGVLHFHKSETPFTYASGKDRNGVSFKEVQPVNSVIHRDEAISAENIQTLIQEERIQLISSRDQHPGQRAIWVSKTEFWFDLAGKGVWVEGSAEGFGFSFMKETVTSPLLHHRLK